MNTKKVTHAMLLAVFVLSFTFQTALASCEPWNLLCHAAQSFVGDPLTAALPDIEAEVKVSHKIENMWELRQLVSTTQRSLQGVIHTIGDETRLTLETAQAKLVDFTTFLDGRVEERIDQLDAMLQARCLWIQQYTEQVSNHIQEIIRVVSGEVQVITKIASVEAQQILATGGRILQETIRLTGEELRLSMLTASGEMKEIIGKISAETQAAIQAATAGISVLIDKTIAGLERLVHTTEGSSLRILEGTLYIVERGADLTLAIGSAATGFVFLFIAAYGWGLAILRNKVPDAGLTRKFVMVLMVFSFLAALLPFGFLSKDARAYALLPMSQAKIYAQVGQIGERLPAKPKIDTLPDTITIQSGVTSNENLRITGANLLSYGYPQATFGGHELAVAGSETSLVVDLKPLGNDPRAAEYIELRFGNAEPNLRRVRVIYVEATVTPIHITLPIATVSLECTAHGNLSLLDRAYWQPRSLPTGIVVPTGTVIQPLAWDGDDRSPWILLRYGGDEGWYSADPKDGNYFACANVRSLSIRQSPPQIALTPTALPTATPCAEPATACFTASTWTLTDGEETILNWCTVQNAENVAIFDGSKAIGVALAGQLKVAPSQATTYQLIAGYCGGQKTKVLGQIPIEVKAKVLPTSTPVPPTPVPQPELIPFDHGAWEWVQGASTNQGNMVNPWLLELSSGEFTEQWGTEDSALRYGIAVAGDFVAEAKMTYTPNFWQQFAGIGVMARHDPTTWIRIGKLGGTAPGFSTPGVYLVIDQNVNGQSSKLTDIAGSQDETVYLKIIRRGTSVVYSIGS